MNGAPDDMTFEPSHRKKKGKHQPSSDANGRSPSAPLPPIHHSAQLNVPLCGLCAKRHGDGPGECVMTERSEHLAEFREMLLLHADDEPWKERVSRPCRWSPPLFPSFNFSFVQSQAIRAIDNTLFLRGHIALITGQPLYPLRTAPNPVNPTIPASIRSVVSNHQSSQIPNTTSSGIHQNVLHSQPGPSHVPATAPPSLMQPKPVPRQFLNATAGPSKRPGSPRLEEPVKKKKANPPADPLSSPFCPVCNKSPHHLVKDCPLVTQGSQR
jgi:chromodomain-helicase-DNA-binding protein 4